MATVFRSHDKVLQVDRAIKVLAPAFANNAAIRTRFLEEARTMARLKHQNIVSVFDIAMDDGRPFIVMEMIQGGSLMDWVDQNGPLSPLAAAWTVIGLLRGLDVAHTNGVIHRDVKPHNLLLSKDGVPKLTDFGIAQANTNHGLTRTGAVMGTMAYMSPEQRRDSKDLGATTDIYSTGATLYVILTGREPFDLYSTELADQLYEGVNQDLATIIQRASRYASADRYPSANDMIAALMGVVDTLPPDDRVSADGRIMLVNTKVDTTVVWGGEGTDSGDQADEADDGGTLCFDSFSEPAPPAPGPEATQNTAKTKLILGAVALVAVGIFGRDLLMGEPTASPTPIDAVEVQIDPPVEAVARPETASTPATPVPESRPEPLPTPTKPKTPKATKASKAASKKAKTSPKPPPEPRKAPKASATANAKKSQAFINARPWATLEIDGAAVGRTGWKGQLTAGSHHIKLTAGDGRTHSQTFLVTEGKPARVCWNFDLSARCQR